MRSSLDGTYQRTDMWREGKWLDLWSVVHFLSGISLAYGLSFFHFDIVPTIIIALLLLIGYEMFEHIVDIEETITNRIMDVVVGMLSFAPMILLVPALPRYEFYLSFATVLTINIGLSIIGWRTSQKAYELEQKVRAEIEKRRARMKARHAQRLARRHALSSMLLNNSDRH